MASPADENAGFFPPGWNYRGIRNLRVGYSESLVSLISFARNLQGDVLLRVVDVHGEVGERLWASRTC
jgi:hypothetical protein